MGQGKLEMGTLTGPTHFWGALLSYRGFEELQRQFAYHLSTAMMCDNVCMCAVCVCADVYFFFIAGVSPLLCAPSDPTSHAALLATQLRSHKAAVDKLTLMKGQLQAHIAETGEAQWPGADMLFTLSQCPCTSSCSWRVHEHNALGAWG